MSCEITLSKSPDDPEGRCRAGQGDLESDRVVVMTHAERRIVEFLAN